MNAQPVLKQVTYPTFQWEVQALPGGDGVVLAIVTPVEVVILPMTSEAAGQLGKKLTAPRIIIPANGAGARA